MLKNSPLAFLMTALLASVALPTIAVAPGVAEEAAPAKAPAPPAIRVSAAEMRDIVEKLYQWSDCSGDLETVFTRVDVLNWVTAYWVTGAIGTSFAPYAHREPLPAPITPPTAFTMFPRNMVSAPREYAARFFDIRSWVEASGGGHFDAWERPADYVAGIRAAVTHRKH